MPVSEDDGLPTYIGIKYTTQIEHLEEAHMAGPVAASCSWGGKNSMHNQ